MCVKLVMENVSQNFKGNIFRFGVEWMRGRKNVHFLMENWPYFGNGER